MKKGYALILMILVSIIILIVLFLSTKFILPNPQTVQENKKIQQDAQDAVNKYQQRNTQEQSVQP
ncbi:MAG: hypothetical protein AAB512_03410 [Patescibacteria group bacterium]